MKKQDKKKPAKRTKAKPLSARKPAKPVREDEENHRILVENSRDGAFILRGDTVALTNKALAVMTGYPSKKMIGMDFKSLLPPDSAFLGKIRKMRSKGDFDLHLLHREVAVGLHVIVDLLRQTAFLRVIEHGVDAETDDGRHTDRNHHLHEGIPFIQSQKLQAELPGKGLPLDRLQQDVIPLTPPELLAVMAMTGMSGSSTAGSLARRRRVASKPSMTGIWQSIRTRSKGSLASRPSAWAPSSARASW